MNAKEALLFELGDFGIPEAVAKDEKKEDISAWVEVSPEEMEEYEFIDEEETDEEPTGEVSLSNLTPEEREACIEATQEALKDATNSPNAFYWGLDFLKKMWDEQDTELMARFNVIPEEELRDSLAAHAEEEEAAEEADKEAFLQI